MAHDRTTRTRTSASVAWRDWFVVASVLAALVGVPALLLAEIEFGLLSALGFPRQSTLAVAAMIPGFALGGLSLLVMLGSN